MQHGESVLAYEQDENTYNICKIERRVCRDGKLSGTFDLQSCVLNSQYRYFQEPFEVYNDPRVEDDDSLTQVSVSSSSSSSAQQSSVVVFPKISSGPVVSSPLPEDSGS
ncbi:hypothetical protein J5893_02375 [bacterium]|nr:hypothetical protein [bacterium]